MMAYLAIAAGGALGSLARYWLSTAIETRIGTSFPWGTLAVNVTGCFAIGFFAALAPADGRHGWGDSARAFFMTGLCGGYTTFSAFSLQTWALAREGAWLRAGTYTASSVLACLLAVVAGYALAHAVRRG